METDLQIRGKVAQFGRGAMEQVAGRMLERFADNVEKAIRGDEPEPRPARRSRLPRPRIPAGSSGRSPAARSASAPAS